MSWKPFLLPFAILFVAALVTGIIFWYFQTSRTQPSPVQVANLAGSQLELQLNSEIAEARLVWKDKRALSNLFADLVAKAQTNTWISELQKENINSLKKIVIILVPYDQPQLVWFGGSAETGETTIASGDYKQEGNTLFLYVNIKSSSLKNGDAILNEQVVSLFMLFAPPPHPSLNLTQDGQSGKSPESWSPKDVYTEMVQKYFMHESEGGTSLVYPIHIDVK